MASYRLCVAALVAFAALHLVLAQPSYNVADGDLNTLSAYNFLASYCFGSGGMFTWSVYTGGIPESTPLSLYVYDQASWQKATTTGLTCTQRTGYSINQFVIKDNVLSSTSFPSTGYYYTAIANCALNQGWYIQYHLNATNTCVY